MATEEVTSAAIQPEIDILDNFDIERFKEIPQHEGNIQSLIERYGDDWTVCTFIKSMGAAGIELVQKLVAAQTDTNRGPTMREIMAAKKAREQTDKTVEIEPITPPKIDRTVPKHTQGEANDIRSRQLEQMSLNRLPETAIKPTPTNRDVVRNVEREQILERLVRSDDIPTQVDLAQTTLTKIERRQSEAIFVSKSETIADIKEQLFDVLPLERRTVTSQRLEQKLENALIISERPDAIFTESIVETLEIDGVEVEITEGIFDDEVEDTFERLVALLTINNEQKETTSLELESDAPEPAPTNVFEEFMAAQPPLEVPLNIEAIQAVANEQPLEETFISLALLLEQSPRENEDIKDLTKLLNELSEAFAQPINVVGFKSESVRITPEITKNLLILLRLIGYENPGEVLLEFIAKHDMEFLIQAIRYLAQLTNQDSQQESLHTQSYNLFPTNLVYPQTAWVGKLVLLLVRGNLTVNA